MICKFRPVDIDTCRYCPYHVNQKDKANLTNKIEANALVPDNVIVQPAQTTIVSRKEKNEDKNTKPATEAEPTPFILDKYLLSLKSRCDIKFLILF